MRSEDIPQLAANCTRFLDGHGPRTVSDLLTRIAQSPLSQLRNDHYGRGGYVVELEAEVAAILGKEAAVFMPSGTMAQQIALRIWSDWAGVPTVAYHPTCHLEKYEFMAYRELHHLRAVLLGEDDRLFTVDDLRGVEEPVSTLLIELPQREIGGQLSSWDDLNAICDEARSRGMKLHLDGARLWESGPFYGKSYAEIAAPFDSVYVSFYKILRGLPGAILAGPAPLIEEARIWQRRHGGNLHQQSPSAISAKLGMDEYLPKMPAYVAKAGEIADALRTLQGIRIVPERPPTNMMHLYLSGDPDRLLEAALQIAEEDRVGLFFGRSDTGKLEISVGEAAMQLETSEIRGLFEKLFQLAA